MKKAVYFTFLILFVHITSAQWMQQGSDIDGEAAGDRSGTSVSLSNDGSRLAVGAPDNNGNGIGSGHVRIYEFNGADWIQLGTDINGETAESWAGTAVSLSGNGNRIAVGAPNNNGNGVSSGHVRIYEFNGANWIQLGSDIDGENVFNYSGRALSLNEDGSRVAIGADLNNNANGAAAGHARVYEFNGADWIQLGSDIDGDGINNYFGTGISLNSTGDRLAVGGPGNSNNGNQSGHVRIYDYDGVNWIQLGADINGETLSNNSGSAVSLNSNGNRVAIGAPGNDDNGNNSGHVRVYEFDGANWIQTGADIDGEGPEDFSGIDVSLSSNGNRVAIGAGHNNGNGNDSGHVRVYEFDGANWIQLYTDIDGEAAGDRFGHSVSLSADGNILAVGGFNNDDNGNNSGHTRVYSGPMMLLYTAIPDPNFEQALINQGIDSEGILDGQALTSDIAGVSTLLISNLGISDLTGIEDFSALFSLRCDMNQLSVLDMSNNPNLTNLSCTNNQLTSINVSNNSNLRRLFCQGNQLTELDVTGLTLLNSFNAANNPMLSCIAVDNPVNAMAQTGLYTAWVVDDFMVFANDCGMMARGADTWNVKAFENGIKKQDDMINVQSLRLYPNPVSDRLYITAPEGEAIVKVTVYNLRGEVVLTTTSGTINVGSLSAGLYFAGIQTSSQKEDIYRKFIVSAKGRMR